MICSMDKTQTDLESEAPATPAEEGAAPIRLGSRAANPTCEAGLFLPLPFKGEIGGARHSAEPFAMPAIRALIYSRSCR